MTNLAQHKEIDTSAGRFEWERLLRRIVMPWRLKSFAFLLSTWADPDGTRVRPGVEVMAAVTGMSKSTVQRLLKELRDDYGLIEQTSRGGGRGGRGKVTSYRLSVPTDLLDRVEMLLPGDRPARMTGHLVTVQSDQSEVTQVTPQSPVPTANASTLNGHPDDLSMANGNDFHQSQGTPQTPLRGQKNGLRCHPGDRLPPTRPTTTDHPTDQDPAQPQTAHEDSPTDPSQIEEEQPRAAPRKCGHGFPAGRRPDGVRICAFCRRAEQEST